MCMCGWLVLSIGLCRYHIIRIFIIYNKYVAIIVHICMCWVRSLIVSQRYLSLCVTMGHQALKKDLTTKINIPSYLSPSPSDSTGFDEWTSTDP